MQPNRAYVVLGVTTSGPSLFVSGTTPVFFIQYMVLTPDGTPVENTSLPSYDGDGAYHLRVSFTYGDDTTDLIKAAIRADQGDSSILVDVIG